VLGGATAVADARGLLDGGLCGAPDAAIDGASEGSGRVESNLVDIGSG